MNKPCIELYNTFYYTNTLDKSLSDILSKGLHIPRGGLMNDNPDLYIYNGSLT